MRGTPALNARSLNSSTIPQVAVDVYRRAIQRAEEVLGSEERLARYLCVPPRTLQEWRSGSEIPPLAVFLCCVDVILDDERTSTTQLYLGNRRGPGAGSR
jgi:hypothetical protein